MVASLDEVSFEAVTLTMPQHPPRSGDLKRHLQHPRGSGG